MLDMQWLASRAAEMAAGLSRSSCLGRRTLRLTVIYGRRRQRFRRPPCYFEAGLTVSPDDLLFAQGEGQVVFFCGSGMSRECAGLPSFFGSASRVLKELGATHKSAAKRIFDVTRIVPLLWRPIVCDAALSARFLERIYARSAG